MKGYAQSQDVSLGIDGTYMGMAVSESVFKITTEHLYGDVKPAIIRAVYISTICCCFFGVTNWCFCIVLVAMGIMSL